MAISLQRVYEPAAGGQRLLVDRLWPRGVSKDEAALAEWCKEVAPSTELRKWYGHEPERFPEFQRRYLEELDEVPASDIVEDIVERARTDDVVLVTATKDVDHSGARVLLEHLEDERAKHENVDHLIDSWGEDSFPASDPPGRLPPTMKSR